MAVLVCGGAGYIGSHCVKALIEKGEEVVVVDSLVTGHKKSVHKKAYFYKLDINNKKKLKEVFNKHKIESCIHFAAYSLVGESMKNPLKYFNNNVASTINLLKVLNEYKVKRIVFSSTAAVYGNPSQKLIDEETKKSPTNPYGESKLAMEKLIYWNSIASEMDYIALRYFNVAGSSNDNSIGEDHNPETHLIPVVIKRALNKEKIFIYGDDYNTADGTCVRDYIYIEDLVDAHILALNALRGGKKSNVYNLGYSHGFSVKEIIDAIKRVTKLDMDVEVTSRREGDPDFLVADSSKIKEELGWNPKRDDLDYIIETAFAWHKDNMEGYGD